MIKINLISDLQEKKVKTKKVNSYVTMGSVGFIVVILVTILFIWGVIVAEQTITNKTNKDIATAEAELAQYKDLETVVISLEKGLASAKTILNGKDNWTRLLVHMEAAAPKDVQYTKLKLTDGKIEADLNGKSVDSISRYIESYKGYKVMVLRGTGQNGDKITVASSGKQGTTTVNGDGAWVYSIETDPAKDQEITVTKTGIVNSENDSVSKVTYTASDKKIVTENGITANIKNLFSAVESPGYTKNPDGTIKFSAKMNFEGSDLW
jgi:VCBS repeat-containing protein